MMQAETQTADRLAILEQIARYSYAWDDRDLEAYVALFTGDAAFVVDPELPGGPSVNATGHEAIRTWARERMDARKPGVQVRHHQSGTLFDELGEDQARTRTMLLTSRVGPDGEPPGSGVYYDEWRRTAEGWRFAKRTLRHDFPAQP